MKTLLPILAILCIYSCKPIISYEQKIDSCAKNQQPTFQIDGFYYQLNKEDVQEVKLFTKEGYCCTMPNHSFSIDSTKTIYENLEKIGLRLNEETESWGIYKTDDNKIQLQSYYTTGVMVPFPIGGKSVITENIKIINDTTLIIVDRTYGDEEISMKNDTLKFFKTSKPYHKPKEVKVLCEE